MNAPKFHNDGDEKDWYFFVQPEHTPKLIEFLRKNLDGFSVDIGVMVIDHKKDEDGFTIPKTVKRAALEGLLETFYKQI